MPPLSLAHMDVMFKEDADAALRNRRLELIATETIVRRSVFGDARVAVTEAIARNGKEYMTQVLSYEEEHFRYTWYGQVAEAKVNFYRRRGESILRARISGEI